MRAVGLAAVALTLAGCEGTDDGAQQQPSPRPTSLVTPTQTSIMRPEIASPEPTPTALGPLEVVIGFPNGGSAIAPTEVAKLERVIASPQVAAGGSVRIGAHSDSSGSDSDNLTASRKRGEAVLGWLRQNGIAEDRIRMIVFGEQNPARPNALPDGNPDEAGRRANRRVEITVVGVVAPTPAPREPTLAEEIVDDQAT